MLVRKKKSRYDWTPQKGYGRLWGWIALDPRSRLVACWNVSGQTLDACRAFLSELKGRLTTIPLFMTDQLGHYEVVLWELYRTCSTSISGTIPSREERARQVHPDLDYARVVKERKGRRVVKVSTDIMYGDPERIARRLKGQKINTAYVERFNQTLRTSNRHLVRRCITFSKVKVQFEARINIFIAYYNLVRVHGSLVVEENSRKVRLTPAQAAGLCKHRWTLEALLAYPSI